MDDPITSLISRTYRMTPTSPRRLYLLLRDPRSKGFTGLRYVLWTKVKLYALISF